MSEIPTTGKMLSVRELRGKGRYRAWGIL
ncbi:helix-turn-helix domain-containing protein [Devosia sp.]